MLIIFTCSFCFPIFLDGNQEQEIFLHWHFLLFTGVIFDFFNGLHFNFYACKFTKILKGQDPFSPALYGDFLFLHDQATLFHARKIIITDDGFILLPLLILLRVCIRFTGIFL